MTTSCFCLTERPEGIIHFIGTDRHRTGTVQKHSRLVWVSVLEAGLKSVGAKGRSRRGRGREDCGGKQKKSQAQRSHKSSRVQMDSPVTGKHVTFLFTPREECDGAHKGNCSIVTPLMHTVPQWPGPQQASVCCPNSSPGTQGHSATKPRLGSR